MLNNITPWAKIRELYSQGASLYRLAEDFGLKYSTVKNRSSKEKWKESTRKVLGTFNRKYSEVLGKVPTPRKSNTTDVPFVSTLLPDVTKKVFDTIEVCYGIGQQVNKARKGVVAPKVLTELSFAIKNISTAIKDLHSIIRLENDQSTENKALNQRITINDNDELKRILEVEAADE